MSSPTRASDLSLEAQPRPPQMMSLGWALRRAALGLLMLLVMVVLGAWLLYASIDPDEASASPQGRGENAAQQH